MGCCISTQPMVPPAFIAYKARKIPTHSGLGIGAVFQPMATWKVGISDARARGWKNRQIKIAFCIKTAGCTGKGAMEETFAQAYKSLQDADSGFICLNHKTDCMLKDAVRPYSGKLDEDSQDALTRVLVDETERVQCRAYIEGFKQAFRIAARILMAG